VDPKQTIRTGWIMLIASIPVAVSPILLALVLIPLTCGGFSGANEGNCGAAALPWFLFMSVPFGILLAIAGAIVLAVGARRQSVAERKQRYEQ